MGTCLKIITMICSYSGSSLSPVEEAMDLLYCLYLLLAFIVVSVRRFCASGDELSPYPWGRIMRKLKKLRSMFQQQ